MFNKPICECPKLLQSGKDQIFHRIPIDCSRTPKDIIWSCDTHIQTLERNIEELQTKIKNLKELKEFNMKKQLEVKSEYIFDGRDIRTIKECLNYCYHRLSRHQCGAPIELEEVQRLRREMGVPMKKEKKGYDLPEDFYGISQIEIEETYDDDEYCYEPDHYPFPLF